MNNLEIIRARSSWVKTSRSVCAGVTPAAQERIELAGRPAPFLKFATSDGGVLSVWSNQNEGDFAVGPVVWFGGNSKTEVCVLGDDAVGALAVLAGLGLTTIEEFWIGAEIDSPNRALTHWLQQTCGATAPADLRRTVQSLTDAHGELSRCSRSSPHTDETSRSCPTDDLC